MIGKVQQHKDAIDMDTLLPRVRWREDAATPAR
jgi:hypothetical protein